MSTRKDLQILRTLANSTEPLSVEDLVGMTGLLWQTVAGLVFIMERDGWMEREAASTTLKRPRGGLALCAEDGAALVGMARGKWSGDGLQVVVMRVEVNQ